MSIVSSLFGTKAPRIVEIAPLGARFEVPAGKTILEAALSAGIMFPHDCTVGTCDVQIQTDCGAGERA
jgi:p-cymene monooxygenase electron transfer component